MALVMPEASTTEPASNAPRPRPNLGEQDVLRLRLMTYIRQDIARALYGWVSVAREIDGYSSRSGIDAVGGSPKGSFVRPAAFTAQVERALDEAARSEPADYYRASERKWWGRWREALRAQDWDEQKVVGYRVGYQCEQALTQEETSEALGLGFGITRVRRLEATGMRGMVLWLWRERTLDGLYDAWGRWPRPAVGG